MCDRIKSLSQLPTSFLEYVSLVPPFEDARGQHASCVTRCVAYNVDSSRYEQARRPKTTGRCYCDTIKPPVAAVNEALRSEEIPRPGCLCAIEIQLGSGCSKVFADYWTC